MPSCNINHTDTLIEIGREADLWHTPDHRAFATLEVGGVRQNLEVEGKQFHQRLARAFYEREGTAASSDALKRAIEVLSADAVFQGSQHEVHVRVGGQDGKVYIDLGDPEWRAVEIKSDGWKVIKNPPVRFCRSPGMRPFPEPQHGGDLNELRPFVNVRGEDDFILTVAWLLGALRTSGPYPVALIQGEQGSAKSTLTKVLRALTDPATPTHGTTPRSERDLAISAHNSWVQAFDNLSGVSDWLSDAFCRLATGGGFRTRKLYSDTDETILQLCRPQILNGIEDLATRDDLRDRGLLFDLPVIPSTKRQREKTFWAEFDLVRPRLLGALLDAVSQALRGESSVHVDRLPRMADFAAWIIAAEPVLPWERGDFLRAYERNRKEALSLVLDHEPLARCMQQFAQHHREWAGTATQLLEAVRREPGGERLPDGPAALSQTLKRLAPALREVGVHVTWHRDNTPARTRKIVVQAVHVVHEAEATEGVTV